MSHGPEIPAGTVGTANLNPGGEVCGSAMGAVNEFSENPTLSDESVDKSETFNSVKILSGSTGDEATVEDRASPDERMRGDAHLPSSVKDGILQHLLSDTEKVNAEETNSRENDAHELLQCGKDVLGFGDLGEILIGEEGIPASLASDVMGLKGDMPDSVSGYVDQGDTEGRREEHTEPAAKQLSKSALKQIAKQERSREIKKQRKAAQKEKKHQETARKRREWEEKLANLTEKEKEEARLEKGSLRKERKHEQNSRKEKLRRALETGQNLVIDLDFSELMKPNEITSLIQQVMYSYAANGRAAVPGRISLTGVRGDVRKELEKISGFNNWLVHKEEDSYLEVFKERQTDLVYLTADSENILESLDITKIYIIGGLVDRNRWKNITLEKAMQQKIATAKLPIGDHLKMMASQVLTVNQVVELLLCFLEEGDWKKSLMKVVPLRKRAAEDGFQGSEGQ